MTRMRLASLLPLVAIVLSLGCGSSLDEVNPEPAGREVFPAGPLIVRQGDVAVVANAGGWVDLLPF
jgi:hypothetical protein